MLFYLIFQKVQRCCLYLCENVCPYCLFFTRFSVGKLHQKLFYNTTVPNSCKWIALSRIRETTITLPCSREQKQELEHKAKALGMSVANYLRSILGFPLEQQGRRNDLSEYTANVVVQNDVQEASQKNIEHAMIARNEG